MIAAPATQETFWGDVAWLWGTSWTQHIIFIVVLLMAIGAVYSGWIEGDNALRLNKRLKRDEAERP